MRTVHQMTIGKDRTPYFLAATAEQLSVIQDALEKNYYQPIRNELEKRFKEKFVAYYLEITDRGQFSDELKEQFPPTREIVFRFLKEAYPDITGFVKDANGLSDFVIVEIKNERIDLDDIYQAKYSDLFAAKYAFLISNNRIPEDIKRLHRVANLFFQFNSGWIVYFGQYDSATRRINEDSWFPLNPFKTAEVTTEGLFLKRAAVLSKTGARLHIENRSMQYITIKKYSINSPESKVLAPAVSILAGSSAVIPMTPNPGQVFERGKNYEVRVWNDRGNEFDFDVVL